MPSYNVYFVVIRVLFIYSGPVARGTLVLFSLATTHEDMKQEVPRKKWNMVQELYFLLYAMENTTRKDHVRVSI